MPGAPEERRALQPLSAALPAKPLLRAGPTLEQEVAHLKSTVEALTAELAQLRNECVRQSQQGELLLPRTDCNVTLRVTSLSIVGTTGPVDISGRLSCKSLSCDTLSGRAITASNGEFAKVKSGTVDADTVKAVNVNGQVYTPGAGNIW